MTSQSPDKICQSSDNTCHSSCISHYPQHLTNEIAQLKSSTFHLLKKKKSASKA